MADQEAATTKTDAAVAEQTILDKSGSSVVSEGETVLDTAGAEEKAAKEADNKRLIEAKDEDLTPEEKTTKAGLIKAKTEADEKATLEAKKKGVPEKYDLKAPEGLKLDEEGLAKATTVFKEAGLTNAQAQILTNYHAKLMQDAFAENEATFKKWNEDNTKETMKALGANAKSELAYVAKVKNMFSPETLEAINASGIGNIKAFILDMAKIGRLFSEERTVNDKGSPTGNTGKSDAEVLYPNMAK